MSHSNAILGSVSQLMLAEVVGKSHTSRILHVEPPANVSRDHFAAYAVYEKKKLARLALVNLAQLNKTEAANSTSGVWVNLPKSNRPAQVKRMTAPGLDEKDADRVTWAGQAYTNGTAFGNLKVERASGGGVWVRDSEAVLVVL